MPTRHHWRAKIILGKLSSSVEVVSGCLELDSVELSGTTIYCQLQKAIRIHRCVVTQLLSLSSSEGHNHLNHSSKHALLPLQASSSVTLGATVAVWWNSSHGKRLSLHGISVVGGPQACRGKAMQLEQSNCTAFSTVCYCTLSLISPPMQLWRLSYRNQSPFQKAKTSLTPQQHALHCIQGYLSFRKVGENALWQSAALPPTEHLSSAATTAKFSLPSWHVSDGLQSAWVHSSIGSPSSLDHSDPFFFSVQDLAHKTIYTAAAFVRSRPLTRIRLGVI